MMTRNTDFERRLADLEIANVDLSAETKRLGTTLQAGLEQVVGSVNLSEANASTVQNTASNLVEQTTWVWFALLALGLFLVVKWKKV